MDWSSVLGDTRPWVLVANLPYNIATPLVADLLDGVPAIERMLVMVQREVGERLAAHVGDDGYGAVSVKVDYWASARVVGKVPASVFVPRPNVESALVEIVRRPVPAIDPGVVTRRRPVRARPYRLRPAAQDAAPSARRRRQRGRLCLCQRRP